MTRKEHAARLRADTTTHYNCCQSVLIPFCDLCGIDPDTAFRLGQHFGSGMKLGSVCGVITGGLMVLGMVGAEDDKVRQFQNYFRTNCGATDCAVLLKQAHDRGLERKCHCDGMVFAAIEQLEALLSE